MGGIKKQKEERLLKEVDEKLADVYNSEGFLLLIEDSKLKLYAFEAKNKEFPIEQENTW